MKIIISGCPRSGKTTLAKKISTTYSIKLFHTDDLINLGWSQCSDEVCRLISMKLDNWIIEGVASVRALRKWLETNSGPPCDDVIWLGNPFINLSNGQMAMWKGCQGIWKQIHIDLASRGVVITDGIPVL